MSLDPRSYLGLGADHLASIQKYERLLQRQIHVEADGYLELLQELSRLEHELQCAEAVTLLALLQYVRHTAKQTARDYVHTGDRHAYHANLDEVTYAFNQLLEGYSAIPAYLFLWFYVKAYFFQIIIDFQLVNNVRFHDDSQREAYHMHTHRVLCM